LGGVLFSEEEEGLQRRDASFAGGRDDLEAAARDVAGGEDPGDIRALEAIDGDALLGVDIQPGLLEEGAGRISRKMKTAETGRTSDPEGASTTTPVTRPSPRISPILARA